MVSGHPQAFVKIKSFRACEGVAEQMSCKMRASSCPRCYLSKKRDGLGLLLGRKAGLRAQI